MRGYGRKGMKGGRKMGSGKTIASKSGKKLGGGKIKTLFTTRAMAGR